MSTTAAHQKSLECLKQLLPILPNHLITLTFNNKNAIEPGDELTPYEVSKPPTAITWLTHPSKFYTLILVDLDAPSHRMSWLLSPINHWLVGNIAGCDVTGTGDVIVEYRGSGPPRGTGLHRYVFLAFEHDEKIAFEGRLAADALWGRIRCNVSDFMKRYGFQSAHAVNYFYAQWESPPGRDDGRKCAIL